MKFKKEPASWITVKGNHIPIMKGQSKKDAVSLFFKEKSPEMEKDSSLTGGAGSENDIIVPRTLGASAKNYPVKLLNSNQHTKLAEGQTIEGKTFAGKGTKTPIRDRFRLESWYKIPASEWQKVSGNGKIVIDGAEQLVELHWYEARGEKYEIKAVRYLE